MNDKLKEIFRSAFPDIGEEHFNLLWESMMEIVKQEDKVVDFKDFDSKIHELTVKKAIDNEDYELAKKETEIFNKFWNKNNE